MNNERWLSQYFFIFFLTWGVYLQYWSGWLTEAKGLTVSEAGYIMGVGLVARALSTMFAFPIASKYLSQRKLITILVICSLVITIIYIPANSFVSLFVITFIFSLIYPSLLPAIENSATTIMQKTRINYGKSRSYGSIGFIIAVLITSFIVGFIGEQAILWSMIVFLLLLLVMQFRVAPSELDIKPTVEDRGKSSSMAGLFKEKGFVIVLVIVILLQGSMASYYSYSYLYLQHLDVNTMLIGIILNIAVLSEIIYFMKADRLAHLKISTLFLIAGIASTLRWILIFLFPNIWVFILSQSLHSLSFGMAHFAYIQYISKTLPKQQLSNAQGIYSALAMGLSTAVLTWFGGYLYEIEPSLSFLGMIVFTIPAILFILMTRKKFQY